MMSVYNMMNDTETNKPILRNYPCILWLENRS